MATITQADVRRCLSLLTPTRVINRSKTRVGKNGDGGYTMLEDLSNNPVCYSLGVGPDTSWDIDMAGRGSQVYQYDHTVERAPSEHKNCHFSKIGISSVDQENMRRIDTLIRKNGHEGRSDMILKMDIEGSEWDCLETVQSSTLAQFRQIALELHWIDHLIDSGFAERFERIIGCVRRTHEPIHVHANNYADFQVLLGVPVPSVLEVSFVRRSDYAFADTVEVFPGPLDLPNNPTKADYYLGQFKF